jgi:hypothetical protein
MYTRTLEYLLGEDIQKQTIDAEHETKTQGKVIVGRDPVTCDFVVTNDTNEELVLYRYCNFVFSD